MIIKRLEIDGFGCFSNRIIELNNGLNLIHGINGSGKSTLMAFIKMMFYSKCGNEKSSDLLKNPRKKYRPLDGSLMAGAIVFECDNQEYRLHKEFKKSPSSDVTTLWNVTKGQIVSLPASSEVGESFLGLTFGEFDRSVFIDRTGSFSADSDSFSLESKIDNLSLSGDENISQKTVLERLTTAKEELVSKSGRKGLYVDLENEISSLQNKKDQLLAQINEQASLDEQITKLEDEIVCDEQALQKAEAVEKVKSAQNNLRIYQLLLEKKQQLKSMEDKANQLTAIEASNADANKIVRENLNRNSMIFSILALLSAVAFVLSGLLAHNLLFFGLIFSVCFIFLSLCAKNKAKDISQNTAVSSELETLMSDIAILKHDIQTISDTASINDDIASNHSFIKEKINKLEAFIESNPIINTENIIPITAMALRQKRNVLNELYRRQTIPDADIGEIQQLMSQKTDTLKSLKLRYESLCLAETVMEDAISETNSSLGVFLNDRTTEYLRILNPDKYDDVLVSDTLDIAVKSANDTSYRQWQYLSRGYIDRTYFALRLAVADAILSDKPSVPLFLDDIFEKYDDKSCEAALSILKSRTELSNGQILLFTCHDYMSDTVKGIFDDINEIYLQ